MGGLLAQGLEGGHTGSALFALRLCHPQGSANTLYSTYFKVQRTEKRREIREKKAEKMERAKETFFSS